MGKRLTEFPDRREWDLSGFTLERVCLSWQAELQIATADSSLTVIIETPFALRTGSHVETIAPKDVLLVGALLPCYIGRSPR